MISIDVVQNMVNQFQWEAYKTRPELTDILDGDQTNEQGYREEPE